MGQQIIEQDENEELPNFQLQPPKLERIQTADESEIDNVLSNLLTQFDEMDVVPKTETPPSHSRSLHAFLEKQTVQPAIPSRPSTPTSVLEQSSSQDSNLDKKSYKCADCKVLIVGKNIKVSESKVYHPDHFKCQAQRQKISGMAQCGKVLTLKTFFEHDSLLYCTPCHTDFLTPKCEYCSMSIKNVSNSYYD